ncbi:MAG TPA: ArgE/DapE family deacylase [Methanoregulaceae archaeon]|nr:MAG: ArgE/DapE family deacylase [Methanolinea sp.]HON80868.1 ArgE/DapE family deacylase [Methanoregulaceae archaeon]HPD09604.1 ArgE/DapE family deacylase [Methanoregulaceae archaeon]HRT15274.1 ArgE/DapE family deacylase [Methanoregulaceae archaeon]HRU30845.1 ArgE/DapE family deacylase [Methanoregulaceae archaeon]
MDVSRICSDLVKIRSENPPGDTRDVIGYIKERTDALGLRTRLIKNRGRKHNLVSSPVRGRLLFCGHVDVVPALADGWDEDPNSGAIRDGKVFGRGATDMKGGCAAILAACGEFLATGEAIPADLAFVCDEETSGRQGIRSLLAKKLLSPCDCIIAEPTPPLNPNIGQKGMMRLRLTFSGEAGHGSLYPVQGVSAVMEAFSFLEFLGKLHRRHYEPDDPRIAKIIRESAGILREVLSMEDAGTILTHIMFNPGKIMGGEKANIIAQRCVLEIDLRLPWGVSPESLLEEIRANAPRASIEVGNVSGPSISSPDSPLVTWILEEILNVHGQPAHPIVQWAASDARYLRKEGFSVVEYGPGVIHTLHAVNEYTTIESLENAVKVYLGMMGRYRDAPGRI